MSEKFTFGQRQERIPVKRVAAVFEPVRSFLKKYNIDPSLQTSISSTDEVALASSSEQSIASLLSIHLEKMRALEATSTSALIQEHIDDAMTPSCYHKGDAP
jgi:hypothetical protein